jgi:hypothetical protein
MVNLAHSASRHSCEKSAPSNHGIKHLIRRFTQSRIGIRVSGAKVQIWAKSAADHT